MTRLPLLVAAVLAAEAAQPGDNVLLVINRNGAESREIGEYYRPRRSIPIRKVCTIATDPAEEISWAKYEQEIERRLPTA